MHGIRSFLKRRDNNIQLKQAMNLRLSLLWKHLPTAASIAVGILPIIILMVWFDVPRKVIGKGALAYAVGAVGIKLPVYHLLVTRVLTGKLSNTWLAFSQGVISAVSELGGALGFFLFVVPELKFAELIGFGVAAGSIEAIILPFMKNPLEGTPLEAHAEETLKNASENPGIQWMGVVERILASLVHIAARGLTYISCFTGNFLPGILATIGFASIDGRAYYAYLEKWRFDDIKVLARFYRFLGAIAGSLIVLFVIFYFCLI